MRIIGLTGGIGSGKSTVSQWLKEWGAPVIDADAVVHSLQRPGEPGWHAIFRHFGWPALNARGEVARKKLGRLVFRDPNAREILDEVIHPLVQAAILDRIETLRRQSVPVVILDIPLLIERGWTAMVDEVWLVAATEEQQMERIRRRDRLGPEEARRRLQAQMPLKQKRRWADRVIDNTGTVTTLKDEVRVLWQSIHDTVARNGYGL